MGENEEKEEDVKGHSHWQDSSHVTKHESHIGLNKDDEDDVEGHKYTDPDSSHFTDPDQKHEV